MATTPNYEGLRRYGVIVVDNALGTTLSAAALTGIANGTRVAHIRIHSAGSSAPGSSKILGILIDDGVSAKVIDTVDIDNTNNEEQAVLDYDNVFLVSTGHSIKFQMTSGLTSGAELHCTVFGMDY